jgi:hypothetical protein
MDLAAPYTPGSERSSPARVVAATAGRRRAIYRLAFVASVPMIALVWALVLLGVLPPTPTDDWVVAFILPALFAPAVAFWDDPGEERTRTQRLAEFAYVWLFTSGMAQTFWELPWFLLDATGWIQGATAADRWLWPWWAYGVADTRYLQSDHAIAGIEFCAGMVGPLELYACWLFKKGRREAANWWALLLGVGLSWGAIIFFVAEIHVGFRNIGDGAYGFWVKWIGLNLPWTLAPIAFIPASIVELREIWMREGARRGGPYQSSRKRKRPSRTRWYTAVVARTSPAL